MNAANPERRPATEEISGLIERVTFHNDNSGFCVLRMNARGAAGETTVVGWLRISDRWRMANDRPAST